MAKAAEKIEIENTKTWLDAGSKAFLILYGVGYFIESYYDSRFGVGYINPLRSKVGFTGIAFGVQIAAAILLFKLEEIVNNSSFCRAASRSSQFRHSNLFRLPYCVTWLGECAVIAFLLIFMFITGVPDTMTQAGHVLGGLFSHGARVPLPGSGIPGVYQTTSNSVGLYYGLVAAAPFAVMSSGGMLALYTRTSRILCAILSTVGGLALLILTAGIGNVLYPKLFLSMTVMVALVRGASALVQSDLRLMSSKRKAFLFLLALTIPILYAQEVYGHVSAQWGGAGASQVTIQYERDVDPFKNPDSVRLLEETDEGFYLVPANMENGRAVYVPRKDVREVRYSSESR